MFPWLVFLYHYFSIHAKLAISYNAILGVLCTNFPVPSDKGKKEEEKTFSFKLNFSLFMFSWFLNTSSYRDPAVHVLPVSALTLKK